MKLKKGFTLIELLIVIAIIGILAVALLPTITAGPQRARDAARVAALNSMVNGLEQNNIDVGGYPQVGASTNPTNVYANTDCLDFTAGIGATIAGYMGSVPKVDKISSGVLCATAGEQFFYRSLAGGASGNYILAVQVETSKAANFDAASVAGVEVRLLSTRAAAVGATDGTVPATGPWYYVISQ